MGRFRITIEAVGCHHNGERAVEVGDADLLAKDFVAAMQAKGHNVSAARFELLGGRDENGGLSPDAVNKETPLNIDYLAADKPVEDAVEATDVGATGGEIGEEIDAEAKTFLGGDAMPVI
jgi:hypothetical protein